MSILPIVNHSLKYNSALDGLRGIAILLVVLFHIWPEAISFGYVGVDIFFILSGFLITQIIVSKLDKESFSFKEFYRNRVRRIFPTMIIVVVVTLIMGYLLLLPNEFSTLGRHAKSSLLFFQNFRLIDESGYWDQASQLKPLLHFWSLSIEEQFYLVWPFLIYFIYKFRFNLVLSMSVIFIILLALGLLIENEPFYNSLSRFWELCFGGFAYVLSKKYDFNQISKFRFLIIGFFFISIFFSTGNTEFNFYTTFLVTFSSVLLVLYLSKETEHIIFSSKILVFFGLISFPLFLWHYIFISFLHILNYNIQDFVFEIIILSIVLSYLTYRYVEIYFRKQTSYKTAYILFFTMVLISLISQYIYAKKGLPNRASLNQKDLLVQQFEKIEHTNGKGKILIEKILGFVPNNDYIRATSTDLSKEFVLIVGDSHAHTSYPGFSKELKEKGIESLILANSGCAPYMQKSRIDCKEKILNIHTLLEKIEMMKNINKVLFITRAQNLKYIEELFRTYESKGIELYFLIENPTLEFSPDVCIQRPFNLSGMKKDCNIKYSEYINKYEEYRNFVINLTKKYTYVKVLDPKDIFCDNDLCYAVRNNIVLYTDTHHHSVNGSYLQAEYLIDEIINK